MTNNIYFFVTEWLPKGHLPDPEVYAKIERWIEILNPIREELNWPIIITDGLRLGDGTSQHYFKGDGATDLRAEFADDSQVYIDKMYELAELIAAEDEIYRVCFYPPGDLFWCGGFHIDRKQTGHKFHVSMPDYVDWQRVTKADFLTEVKEWV